MYPDFQYLVKNIFRINAPEWLGVFKTFGLFVALAFLVASYILTKELKRKEKLGLFKPVKKIKESKVSNEDSSTGTIKTDFIFPHQRVGNIILIAAIGGIIGAKIFNAFETWDNFKSDPIGNLFSGGGLTFYGGLIVAALLLFYYCRKHKIDIRHLADAAAPVLMLAYAIGRFGCHFSGDGDWGVFNSAYTTSFDGTLTKGSPSDYQAALSKSSSYFEADFGSVTNVPSIYTPANSFLPKWLLANNYLNNVIDDGIRLPNCSGNHCNVLPVGVFPTALYEAFICILLFFAIWVLRKFLKYPLHLFAFYLVLNGIERFLIEKIRVNYKYNWGTLNPTQAEIISVILIAIGLGIILLYRSPQLISRE